MTSAYEGGTAPHIEVRHRLRIAREFAGLPTTGSSAWAGAG